MLGLRQFGHDDGGNIAILTALLLPVILVGGGLGLEAASWLYTQAKMQTAADSAALSTMNNGSPRASELVVEASAVVSTYGLAQPLTVEVNNPPTSGAYKDDIQAFEVILTRTESRLLSAIILDGGVTIRVRAVARKDNTGQGCVLALNSSKNGAAATQGSARVKLDACSLFTNSASSSSISIGGASTLQASAVSTVGGISGASRLTTTNGILTRQPSIADPYASIALPSYSGCNHTSLVVQSNLTLQPGVYCRGFAVSSGANVTLSPGTYIFDRGAFSMSGGSSIRGTGVTLVFTSSTGSDWPTMLINGGANVNLVAPSTGPLAGLVIYGDRKMTAGTSFKMTGGSSQVLGGAVYLPKADLSFAGNSSASIACTQVIADTITFSGDSGLSLDCGGLPLKPIGAFIAGLME